MYAVWGQHETIGYEAHVPARRQSPDTGLRLLAPNCILRLLGEMLVFFHSVLRRDLDFVVGMKLKTTYIVKDALALLVLYFVKKNALLHNPHSRSQPRQVPGVDVFVFLHFAPPIINGFQNGHFAQRFTYAEVAAAAR